MFDVKVSASFNLADLIASSEKLTAFVQKIATDRVVEGIRESIINSQTPYGNAFAPLATETLRQRRRRNISGIAPLLATGEMVRSVHSEEVGGKTAIKMDGKVLFHQFGTSRGIPARPTIPWDGGAEIDLPEEWVQDIERAFAQYLS